MVGAQPDAKRTTKHKKEIIRITIRCPLSKAITRIKSIPLKFIYINYIKILLISELWRIRSL